MLNKNTLQSVAIAIFILILFLTLIATTINAYADLIPTNDNPFYYKMGGGQSIASPAFNGAQSVPLRVEGDVGLGYNCGLFNPKLSITNSLNAIQNSFQNIQQSVVSNATGAITQFPMYAISRADPSLYNLLNNGLLGAREDLKFSTKSCQQMQSEISKGQNPYNDWLQASMGNDWKYKMSMANGMKLKKASGDNSGSDINQVKADVEQTNGDNGVPWVHGSNIGRNGNYAGGRGQPPVMVIRDTAIAGYNVILQSGRDYDDTSAPSKNNANSHLVETWVNPTAAADWITNVLGDEKVTTYAGGDKQSSPGVGLLPDNQVITQKVTSDLQNLVSGLQTISLENLKTISAPGVMINTAVINAIRQKPPVTQSILINKLGQEVATAKAIDKALLARQILQEGSQVPAIYGNRAAQDTLKNSISHLDKAIDTLLFNVRVRKELVSDTASQLLNTTQTEQINNSTIQPSGGENPVMEQGAIKNKDNFKTK